MEGENEEEIVGGVKGNGGIIGVKNGNLKELRVEFEKSKGLGELVGGEILFI
ncbi:hypothetical protein [Leuconostoc mesenteroides]|uniref:hypothetical protein n=1 Tax=Leuconostoc mesenteroides TaxID=1245 RepID=UPI001642FF6A|nr:hypothetical protein [Leuconostoc mesenteroides]